MYNMMSFGFSPFGWFGWIFMVLWWIFIVVLIIALIKWIAKQFERSEREKSSLDIARERYAKGEISKEEFEEMKRNLT